MESLLSVQPKPKKADNILIHKPEKVPTLHCTEIEVDGELCRYHLDGRVFYIDHDYRDSLKNTMDFKNDTEKDRPYLVLWYDPWTMVLIPFRSKCSPEWKTSLIYNSRSKDRSGRYPGLDFSKMLFVSNDELSSILTSKAVEMPDYVMNMHDLAEDKIDETLELYQQAKKKADAGGELSGTEKYLLEQSTLANYDIV